MTFRRRELALALGLGVLSASPALAQFTVFDPTNYAQNVLQAARALESVNNQIRSLQNEAELLIGQARNLTGLPFSTLATLQAQFAQTRQLLGEAQGLAYNVADIQASFRASYGTLSIPPDAATLSARADARWNTAVLGFEDALKVQAGVVQGLDADDAQLTGLVTASQGSVGALQVAQAGNQLLALQSRQLADLLALTAAQGRAQTLEAADHTAARADAKARFSKFMGREGTAP